MTKKLHHLTASELLERATWGDHNSQFELGKRYLKGDRVFQNPTKAEYWLNKAALNGNREMQSYKAVIYWLGLGTDQEGKTWVEAFQKLAEKGVVSACTLLVRIYSDISLHEPEYLKQLLEAQRLLIQATKPQGAAEMALAKREHHALLKARNSKTAKLGHGS